MKKILITAGPTREYFDTVRFITNSSTGAQASALADEFLRRNCEVRIISGPVALNYPPACEVIRVVGVREMLDLTRENVKWADFTVFAAAPCDLTPFVRAKKKLKKQNSPIPALIRSPDIAVTVNRDKLSPPSAGFDLEDELDMAAALYKMRKKKFDIIVQNSLPAMASSRTTGYIVSENEVLLFSDISKKNLAGILCEKICRSIN
ncbi:MAG: phosphopantothenoylcysteine decarboxylase [Elusimicrobiota bacterium]|nr:phosphopantothenoylcysteine decarboxylase [Elusimicrobiota bacterium]